MTIEHTEADFATLSWHEDALYGLRLEPADPDAGDWHSDLVLAIDHILEWVKTPEGRMRFRVAPVKLVFHEVGNLSIAVDWQGQMLHDMAVDSIDRTTAEPAGPAGNVPRFNWRIRLNWPKGGVIAFVGGGFTQRLLAEPVLLDGQAFAPAERRRILADAAR